MKFTAKRLFASSTLALAALASVGVCAAELTKVTVLQPITAYDIRYAPWAVAKANGYLAQEGLELDMPLVKGSMVAVQQLVNGGGQYAQLPPDGVVIANSKGADLKFFYSIITRNPFPLAVLETSPIQSLDDLKGKKIGVLSLAAVQFYTTQAILRTRGMEINRDFTLIDVGAGASALAALQRGDVDVLAQDVLIYAGLANRGARFRYMSTPQIDKVFAWGLVTTADNLKKNPAQAEALGRALSKARVFCAAQPAKCVEAYYAEYPNARPAGIPLATAMAEQEKVLKVFLDYGPKPAGGQWGAYAPGAWDAAMDYLVGAKLIDKPVELQRMFTADLLPRINAFDEAAVSK